MSTASAKQQVIQKIKENTNILVTVSRDPSVDELSAALGLTLFLNELGKHATAVFSGKIPPAINFLEPDKTFEDTADSLRDFIIALDKEKADHLRYKIVDDAVVKIFITPYRTTITEADLEFSQGDYNIELVLALNVEDSNHLDEALTAHGKILHSADVVTVTARDIKSSLGAIDWHERNASGVSEMLLELVDELKTVKATLDEQMANAFMTGIVAVTNRFSNNLTSPRVMTAAADLMAAGANQQLIAAKLVEAEELEAPVDEPEDGGDSSELSDAEEAEVDSTKLSISRSSRRQPKQADKDLPKPDDGTLEISHQKRGDLDEVARRTQAEAQDEAARAAESYLEKQLAKSTPEEPVESEEPAKLPEPEYSLPAIKPLSGPQSPKDELPEPSVGGTFNASTEQAAEDKKREAESGRNRTILNHGRPGTSQGGFSDSPINATVARHDDEPKSVDPFAETNNNLQDNRSISPLGEASAIAGHNGDVMAALSEDTSKVLGTNQSLGQPTYEAVSEALAAVPNVPDPLAANSAPGTPTLAEIESSAKNIAGLPPMPDFSTLPELPPAFPPAPAVSPTVPSVPAATPSVVNTTNSEFNPTQFQIPGQN
jgi:hypothetical protein cdivTM_02431